MSDSPSADRFKQWYDALPLDEQQDVYEQVHIALWETEAQFADFPRAPGFQQRHTDGEGRLWTYNGPHHGWHRVRDWRNPR